MKITITKLFGLLSLASLSTPDYAYNWCDFTFPSSCDGFSLDIHSGIAPINWNGRKCFQLIDINFLGPISLGRLISFNSLYKVPWDVGFRIGYQIYPDVELTFEFDYRQANAKCGTHDCNASGSTTCCGQFELCFTTPLLGAGTTHFLFGNLSAYKSYVGHVGARWYTDRYWCDIAFYGGAKIGFAHHRNLTVTLNKVNTSAGGVNSIVAPFPLRNNPFFLSNTTYSGGILAGIDWPFWNQFSLVIQAEILIQGSLRPNKTIVGTLTNNVTSNNNCVVANSCIPLPTNPSASLTLMGASFKREIIFPITAGIKYYF
jgi:hypothetical protein